MDGIGPALRAARERQGWSRETLASRAGVSAAAITQIETGRRKDVRLSSLTALAAALQTTLDQLAASSRANGFAHRALFYDNAEQFMAFAVPYLRDAVDAGEAPLAVTTPLKIRGLQRRLGSVASTINFADSAQWYTAPINALNAYRDYLNEKLDAGAKRVRVLGEPVWQKRSAADIRAWIRYESLINIAFASSPATIVCPYDNRGPRAVRLAAQSTHPEMAGRGAGHSHGYRTPEEVLLEP